MRRLANSAEGEQRSSGGQTKIKRPDKSQVREDPFKAGVIEAGGGGSIKKLNVYDQKASSTHSPRGSLLCAAFCDTKFVTSKI